MRLPSWLAAATFGAASGVVLLLEARLALPLRIPLATVTVLWPASTFVLGYKASGVLQVCARAGLLGAIECLLLYPVGWLAAIGLTRRSGGEVGAMESVASDLDNIAFVVQGRIPLVLGGVCLVGAFIAWSFSEDGSAS